MLRVVVVEPGKALHCAVLDEDPVTVGVLALCTVQVTARGVAPRHIEITRQDEGAARLRILAEAGRVMLNGTPFRGGTIRPGDVVEIAGVLVLVEGVAPARRLEGRTGREVVFAAAGRVFELAERLVEEQPPRALLSRTLDVLMELYGASRSLVVAVDEAGKPPRTLARAGNWPPGRPPQMSRTLLARILEHGRPILVADVEADPDTTGVQSISVGVRSVVAGPLVQKERVLGIVYLESPDGAPGFGEEERRFLERFCRFATRLLTRAREAGELKEESERLLVLHQRTLERPGAIEDLVGESEAIRRVRLQVRQVAMTDVTTLVLGESGTGKELVARAIHRLSGRASRPFVAVNCTALPRDIVESELFGHVAGAFTGARADRPGLFELAHSGTLFLDEVGDLAPDVQAKLLRVLQEQVIQRVGEGRDRRVDVRIVAATNAPLPDRIEQGRFREDLFFRLSVFTIEVPPLRAHSEDVPVLAQTFVERFSHQLGRPIEGIDTRAMEILMRHGWPGNVRELANVVQQAVVRETSSRITASSLSFPLQGRAGSHGSRGADALRATDVGDTFDIAQNRFQIWFLETALAREDGDVARVLERTGIPKATFYRKCAALGIDPSRFRKDHPR